MTMIEFSPVLRVSQSKETPVFCFQATAEEVARIARIDRAGRDESGTLRGFQRPQIAAHIREIRDYLEKPESILPNAIVLGFAGGASLSKSGALKVDLRSGPPGWVVDGQQRLSAALDLQDRRFKLLVSGFICQSLTELNRQFILINNTRPLPRPLIYELLPSVDGLPDRLSSRASAALLTEALNFRKGSALEGLVAQQTNPEGVIRDTILQRVIMASVADGALRPHADDKNALLEHGYGLFNEFFWAVRRIFSDAWEGQTPKTSRLVHGVGIVAMGYVMEELHARLGAATADQFTAGLKPLARKVAWTAGSWDFGTQKRPWNTLQNTQADYRLLAHHLVRLVRVPRLREAAA